MSKYYDISDNEIRVVGSKYSLKSEASPFYRRPIVWILVIVAVAFVAVIYFLLKQPLEPNEPGLFESGDQVAAPIGAETSSQVLLSDYSDTSRLAYTEIIEKTVNDIPLSIYVPHNAIPELCLGSPDYQDKNIILATQAADIRRDNNKIVGAFVLKGELLARGLSKKGYCAIIDGKITVGVADNTPLFEEATAKEGYFFRQYPLVDNHKLVENEPKNKSIRKALCEREGEIFVVKSGTPESFHDFAQALADLGVDNAIYLVGSTAYGFWRDKDGNVEEFSDERQSKYEYRSFILWRAQR